MNLRNIVLKKIHKYSPEKIPTIAFDNNKIGRVVIRFGHDFIVFSVPKNFSSLYAFFYKPTIGEDNNTIYKDEFFKNTIIFHGPYEISKSIGLALNAGLFATTEKQQQDNLLLLIKLYMVLLAIEYDIEEENLHEKIYTILENLEEYKNIFNSSSLFIHPYEFSAFFNEGFSYLKLSQAYLNFSDFPKMHECFLKAKATYDNPIDFAKYWAERMCYSTDNDSRTSMHATQYFVTALDRIKNTTHLNYAKEIVKLCSQWSKDPNPKKAVLLSYIFEKYFLKILEIFMECGFLSEMYKLHKIYILLIFRQDEHKIASNQESRKNLVPGSDSRKTPREKMIIILSDIFKLYVRQERCFLLSRDLNSKECNRLPEIIWAFKDENQNMQQLLAYTAHAIPSIIKTYPLLEKIFNEDFGNQTTQTKRVSFSI